MIRGIVVREGAVALEEFDEEFLGDGDVLVDVAYSDLNYKDALAVTGRPGVVRTTPLVAGIDVIGTVAESSDPRWTPGDWIVLNGAGLSETRNGGYATRARIDGERGHQRDEAARRGGQVGALERGDARAADLVRLLAEPAWKSPGRPCSP